MLIWDDAFKKKAAWDTMIWIGLLVVLASKLNEYGVVAWFGGTIEQNLGGRHDADGVREAGFMMTLIYLGIWLTVGPVWWSVIGLNR